MEFDNVARRLEAVSADVTSVGTRLTAEAPEARGFGVAAVGPLGDLGRALHTHAKAALEARAAEARALGASVADLASSVRGAASAYRDVDQTRGVSTGTGGGPHGSA